MKRKLYILCLFVLPFLYTVKGQEINTLYFMSENPMRHQLNPAFMPEHKIYAGLFPLLSSCSFYVGNNSLTFSDIFKNAVVDGKRETVLFLHPDLNNGVSDFLSAIKGDLKVRMSSNINLLRFGMKVKDMYLTLGVNNTIDVSFSAPKTVLSFALNGVKEEDINGTTEVDFSNVSASALVYSDIDLGIAYSVNKNFNIGAKLKLLSGHSCISSDFDGLTLKISKDAWNFSGNASINSSIPGFYWESDEEGHVSGADIDDVSVSDFFSSSNLGFAADLGATYDFLENLQVSVSVTDLGFIRWKDNLAQLEKGEDFFFDGVVYDINKDDTLDVLDEYAEQLEDMMSVKENPKSFKTRLSAKLYAGAEYTFWQDRIGVGILSKTTFCSTSTMSDLTLSTNFSLCRPVAFSLSYSFMQGSFSNLGLGINVNVGPINMYLLADEIPLVYAKGDGLSIPSRTRGFNIAFGMNLIFKDLKKDMAEHVDSYNE